MTNKAYMVQENDADGCYMMHWECDTKKEAIALARSLDYTPFIRAYEIDLDLLDTERDHEARTKIPY